MNQFNTEAWKNINLIFPDGGAYLDGVWYDNEDIVFLNLPLIESSIVKPIRETTEYKTNIIWYDNGDMERKTIFSTYPAYMIDNIPPLNVYAQKMYNNFLTNLSMKESNLNDFESTYSSL